MAKLKYFDRNGDEIDERAALDHRGALRDGCSLRIPLTIRDTLSPLQRAVADDTAGVPASPMALTTRSHSTSQVSASGSATPGRT